ncbi:hypothetical protein ACNOYE_18610 [Nannocystaceae bacterium ST9]
MNEIETNSEPPNRPPQAEPARGVIDPAWEDELRRGQEAEGEAGSVEPELALVHLLRHVREPEPLAPEQLDSLWSAIEAEVAPALAPWWRKAWLWWSAPALAAAAVLAVIVIENETPEDAATTIARDDAKHDAKREEPRREFAAEAAPTLAPAPGAMARDEAEAERVASADDKANTQGIGGADAGDVSKGASRGAGSNAFENSFEQLAPYGRRAIRSSVDTSLDTLRGQLLADARGASR